MTVNDVIAKLEKFPDRIRKKITAAYEAKDLDKVVSIAVDYEKSIQDGDVNAANAIMKKISDFPENIRSEIQLAFDHKQYRAVIEKATLHDVSKRENLDDKIKMVFNDKFVVTNTVTGNSMSVADLQGEIFAQFFEEIKLAVEQNTTIAGYRWDQPLYLHKAEGIDETFNTAADAMYAYKVKHNLIDEAKVAKRRIQRKTDGLVDPVAAAIVEKNIKKHEKDAIPDQKPFLIGQ